MLRKRFCDLIHPGRKLINIELTVLIKLHMRIPAVFGISILSVGTGYGNKVVICVAKLEFGIGNPVIVTLLFFTGAVPCIQNCAFRVKKFLLNTR